MGAKEKKHENRRLQKKARMDQKNSFYIYMPIEVANKVKRLYKVDAKTMTKMFHLFIHIHSVSIRRFEAVSTTDTIHNKGGHEN